LTKDSIKRLFVKDYNWLCNVFGWIDAGINQE
jgi:hypothetical protein